MLSLRCIGFQDRWLVLLLVAMLRLPPSVPAQAEPTFDLLIKNGRIVDGCGNPWYAADLGIKSGRILRIGKLVNVRAERAVDAKGLVVAPGFINMSAQTAGALLQNPQAANNFLSQGITTILTGEGVSEAPLSEAQARTNGWRTMRQFFLALEHRGLPLNIVQTVGHTQVRRLVMGDTDRAPTPAELEQMQSLVAEAMEAGAVGLSTALSSPPAIYAASDEMAALCQVAGAYGGRYYTHIRDEGDHLIEAVDEALSIGASANIPVHLFHFKAAGRDNWPKMALALARLETARRVGQEVDADIYPYVHARVSLDAFIHPRHLAQGQTAFRRELDSRADRAEMRREMEEDHGWDNWFRRCGGDWDRIILGQIQTPAYHYLNGKSIAEIARSVRKDPWVVFFDIVRSGATAFPESMSEPNKIQALQHDFVSIGTDDGPAGGPNPPGHPRAYGSFPRVLSHYVRELGVIPLERAVCQMTSLPANQSLAYDRGRLTEGLAADVVVFDPNRIRDRATFARPNLESEGIQTVIVNGQVVFEYGRFTGALPGRILRGPGYR